MSLREPWSLQRRARRCHLTEQPFADGDTCHTALFRDTEGNWLRRDYSAEGWRQRPADEHEPFSHWTSTVELPKKGEGEDETPLGRRSPEELLRQLCEEDEDHTENLRFVLALKLERSRKLREQDAQDLGDHRVLVYENPKSGELFLIRDPKLRLNELDGLQEEITSLLEGGPAAPPGETTEPAGGETDPDRGADSVPDKPSSASDPPEAPALSPDPRENIPAEEQD